MRWAVHNHIGVHWDGGVRLIGIYRWLWHAKLVAWWYAKVVNLYALVTVVAVTGKTHEDFLESSSEWCRIYKMLGR